MIFVSIFLLLSVSFQSAVFEQFVNNGGSIKEVHVVSASYNDYSDMLPDWKYSKNQVFDLILATPGSEQKDTDGDGLYDSVERVIGTDYNVSDSDYDQLDDYYEALNGLNPLNPDSNNDGLSDFFEVDNVSLDFDGDGKNNAWDFDNDGDGVNDLVDISPFSQLVVNSNFDFNVETNGNPSYLNFQVVPEDVDHLRLPNQKWDWPDDEEGRMKDLNNSKEDLYITPFLELSMPSVFKISSVNSDKYIEVANSSIFDNASVWQNNYTNLESQHWMIESVGCGFYKIINQNSGKCLEITDNSTSDNVTIRQNSYKNQYSQHWRIEQNQDGFYKIVSRYNDKYLQIGNNSLDNYSEVIQYKYTGLDNQLWKIENVGNSIPDQSYLLKYGVLDVFNKLYIPLNPVVEDGSTVAFSGKMFYPVSDHLNVSFNARLMWWVNGISDKTMKSLKTYNNFYFSVSEKSNNVSANSTVLSDSESFEWVDLGNDLVALKADNNRYVTVDEETDKLVANSSDIGDEETFEVVKVSGNKIGLKAFNDKYVKVDGNSLYAVSSVISNWETFTVIDRGFEPEAVTLVKYYEDFKVTGFSIQENYGSKIGVFYNEDVNQTFASGFVMTYEFLRSQNSVDDMPSILLDNNISMNYNISDVFSHQDAGAVELISKMIPDALSDLNDSVVNKNQPLIVAVEDQFSTSTMDDLNLDYGYSGNSISVSNVDKPVITSKTFKMSWYNTSTQNVLDAVSVFNETYDWLSDTGLEDSDDAFSSMISIYLFWNVGETVITKIGDNNINFVIPEEDEVLSILTDYVWNSVTGIIDITETVLKQGTKALSFLKTVFKGVKSLLSSLKIVKGTATLSKMIKGIQAAQKALSGAKATKFLSVLDRISIWLIVIDLYITAAIAWYMWFSIAIDQDWSEFGVALAFLVFYTYVIYSLTIMIIGIFLPLLALIFVIFDLIFGIFGKFLDWILSCFTKSYMLTEMDIDIVGSPSVDTFDYDDNGMDVGDKIEFKMGINASIKRTSRGSVSQFHNSYVYPYLNLVVPSDSSWDNDETLVNSYTDNVNYKSNVYDLDSWVYPQSMVNFPMKIQLKYNYKVYYKECVWFFGWWCDDEQKTGTQSSDITTLYFDVLPGNISAFLDWTEIESLDNDADGIFNDEEVGYKSNPWLYDTDGDGLWDLYEVEQGTFPYLGDTDGDGLIDSYEFKMNTDPHDIDTDSDGLSDFEEYNGWIINIDYYGTPIELNVTSDPLNNDTDNDGLCDLEEYMTGLNPRSKDTDGDYIIDLDENNIPYQGFIQNVDFNNKGNSITIKPGNSIDTIVNYRITGKDCPGFSNSSNCSITVTLHNISSEASVFNYTVFDNKTINHQIIQNISNFTFNAPNVEDTYIMSYYVNWSCGGIVPVSYVDREIIGIIFVNLTEDNSIVWECYGPGSDTDNDGITNINEVTGWPVTYTDKNGVHTIHVTSNYKTVDTDNDGLIDLWEHNCFKNSTNPRNPDTDGDGLTDPTELVKHTNPLLWDSDFDGLDDQTELNFKSDPNLVDTDFDGLNDSLEFMLKSNPKKNDTDSDGLSDLEEYNFGSSLLLTDTDSDGLFDKQEKNMLTDPNNPDSDNDGLLDGYEYTINTDPKNNDTDFDGADDYTEEYWGTNPLNKDTDNDSLIDGDELKYGTHPLLSDSDFDGENDSVDLDTYAPHVDEIILAYDMMDDEIFSFIENISCFSNVTVVSAKELQSNPVYQNASFILLIGRPDAGNETVGNITKNILLQTGENVTKITESDYYRFNVKYGIWNETQTIVMLTYPYRTDHWIALNIFKNVKKTVLPDTVDLEFPTPRSSFRADAINELDTMIWTYLNKQLLPKINIKKYTDSTTPILLSYNKGMLRPDINLEKYINITVNDEIQNQTNNEINYSIIMMFYKKSDLDKNNDGDTNDPVDIDEKTLCFYYYDKLSDKWLKLNKNMNWVNDLGVDTENIEIYGQQYEGYVYANVTHFSMYSIAGKTNPEPPRPSPGYSPILENQLPVANASKSQKIGIVDEEIIFDATSSIDPDGKIISYHWDFGDNTESNKNITTHMFTKTGVYNVVLTVEDNQNTIDTDNFTVSIIQANNPPSKPVITGPVNLSKNKKYYFNISSIDTDKNNTISYRISWGDNSSLTTSFYENNTVVEINHSWDSKGIYKIIANATDSEKAVSDKTEYFIFVDIYVEKIDDIIKGYIVDEEKDGFFDYYYNITSGEKRKIKDEKDKSVLIEDHGDDKWDYIYNYEKNELSKYKKDTQNKEFLIQLLLIGVILIILFAAYVFYKKKK